MLFSCEAAFMSQLVQKSNWEQTDGELLFWGLVGDYVGQHEHEPVSVSKCHFRGVYKPPLIIGITEKTQEKLLVGVWGAIFSR